MRTILSIRRIAVTLAASAAAVGLLLSAAPLAGAGPAFHHASGGGHFMASGDGGENEFLFAFNARQLNIFGDAKGQLEFHNLTNGTLLHVKIIYLKFLNKKTVGFFGIVTKSVGTKAQIGDCRAVKVQDNGEGKKARLEMLDFASKLYSKNLPRLCDGDPTLIIDWDKLALISLDNGNIQVR